MPSILIVLPQQGFDPSEVALPWRVWRGQGRDVAFATETGAPAACDPITLTGEGLPRHARSLRAHPEAREAYAAMLDDPAYRTPQRWSDARAATHAALLFPGGHAPQMRPYCESPEVARLAREAFAAHQPVAAICHGVLPLARAGVLDGRTTTALTATMEGLAVALTGHYRTYPESVEAEVRRLIGPAGRFERGPLFPRYAGAAAPHAGFVVTDGAYVSGRWPGDAWTLALQMSALLA
jgi:protease I